MAEPKGFLVVPVGFNPSGDLRALELDANDYLKVALAAWLEGAVDVKGYTGAAWTPLLVNASGQAIVVGKGTSEEVNAALLAPARGLVGAHGWVNGAWQKQPMPLGYSGAIAEQVSNLNASAGSNTISGAAVPAGEVWVVTTVAAFNDTTSPTALFLIALIGGFNIYVNRTAAPGIGVPVVQNGYWVLEEGDKMRATMTGCAAGDDLYLMYSGFRVDIDQ